ncbi:MAG: hypothetical protein ABIH19_02255 [Candidatus Omnitrophota bacterium]
MGSFEAVYMIVPMKKITVLVQPKDAASSIAKLRSLGVLHIEHQQPPLSHDLSELQDDLALIDSALGVLLEAGNSQEPKDWKFTARHIIDLRKRVEQLEEYSRTLKSKISQWRDWGDFDPQAIEKFTEKKIYAKLYQIPAKEIKKLEANLIVKKIAITRGIAHCLVISCENFQIPYKELSLPKMGLKMMQDRLAEDIKVVASLKQAILQHRCFYQSLLKEKRSKVSELEFQQALSGMGQSGDISYLSGYTPFDTVDSLEETARREKWGMVVSEPSDEDRVPTLIRNPRWVSIISPIFKVIEVVPGYKELDISLWFLIFFSIFFGMLIGDAAYGFIFLLFTFLAQMKWGRKLKEKSVFNLFYILSSCAIIWGVLSGTFFGQEWLPQWVRPVVPALRSDKNIQTLCFLLGATHLSIAHLWRGVIKYPSLKALSEVGWVLIIWAAFFLAKLLILGDAFPGFMKWFLITGAGLVLLFTNPRKNILKGLGAGLGNLLLNLVNNFTDVVSYIRLFAVGLATVAVADSFNKMALGVGFSSISTGILTAFILLLGHTLNILLGPMSILVHGVRLNVLEFCNHLDIKWSGFAYKPLKEGDSYADGNIISV